LKLVCGVRNPDLSLFSDISAWTITNLNEFKLLAFSADGHHNNCCFPIGEGSLSLDKIWQAAVDMKILLAA